MIISAFADEYESAFDAQLEALSRLGIEYIEPRFIGKKNIADLERDEVEEVKRMLDEKGIKVSAIGSPLGKIALDGDLSVHMEKARRVFETANALGAKYVRVFSFYPPKDKTIGECRDEVIAALSKMLDLAQSYNVVLCHENEARIYGESPEHCLDILEHFGGRLRAVFDMGNFTLEGYDPIRAYGLLKKYVEYFHIKDALSAGAIVPAGCGEARIKEILCEHSKEEKSDFFVSLEPHLQTFSGLNALTSRNFDNPYKFETQQIAFEIAAERLWEIVNSL